MNERDLGKFVVVWQAAHEVYNHHPSRLACEIAFEALRAYGFDKVRIALSKHLRDPDTGMFPPKPADVIKHIEGDSETNAAKAWQAVLHAMKHLGPYRSIDFGDTHIHSAIEMMGGWVRLCCTDEEEIKFRAKDFERYYRAKQMTRATHVPGITEINNTVFGIETEVIRINVGNCKIIGVSKPLKAIELKEEEMDESFIERSGKNHFRDDWEEEEENA
jgi:hypothetical protein